MAPFKNSLFVPLKHSDITSGQSPESWEKAPPQWSPAGSVLRLFVSVLCLISLMAKSVFAEGSIPRVVTSPTPQGGSVAELPEYLPYQVNIRISTSPDLRLNKADELELLSRTRDATDRLWGSCWNTTVVKETDLQPVISATLATQTALQIESTSVIDPTVGKLMQIVVELHQGVWRISGREFDRRSRLLSPIMTRDSADIREIPEKIAQVCTELFRPLVQIEDVDGQRVFVRLLGSGLLPLDPDLQLTRPDSLWLPFYRSLPTKESPKEQVQLIPWTYLRMEAPPTQDQTVCRCELISGVKNSLPARRSHRVEMLALALKPNQGSTEIQVLSRSRDRQPLSAYDVEIQDNHRNFLRSCLTDRKGRIDVSSSEDNPLVWIVIKSGALKMAQIPLVPGVVDRTELEVPSDHARLRAEAQLSILQSRLMDFVVQRATLMGRIKRVTTAVDLTEEDWKSTENLIAALKAIPSKESLKTEVRAIRVSEVKSATQMNDRLGVRRVEKVCDETQELIDRHLDDEKVQDLIDLVTQLRKKSAQETKSMEANPDLILKQINPPSDQTDQQSGPNQ